MQANYSLRTHYSLAFILSAGGELRFPWIPRAVGQGAGGGGFGGEVGGDPLASEKDAFRERPWPET